MKKSHPSGIGTPEMANNEATRSKEIFGSVGVRGFYSLGTFDFIYKIFVVFLFIYLSLDGGLL